MIYFNGLFANYEEKPIGLTEPPRLSWIVEADEEYRQEFFSLYISSDYEKIMEPDVLCIENNYTCESSFDCKELKLEPFCRYFWRVKVCNKLTGECILSDVHEFVTSVLRRSQWTPLVFRKFETVEVSLVRKEFSLKKLPQKAYIFIAASGEKSNGYRAFINGNEINDGMILPGPLEYMTMNVTGFDVTHIIERNNIINFDYLSGISCVLKLYYSDGNNEIITTDSSWTMLDDKKPYILGYIESYQANRHHGKYELYEPSNLTKEWYCYGGDISGCKTSSPEMTFWGPINIRYCGVKTEISEEIEPIDIIETRSGIICDFGKIQSGFISILLHSCKEKIKVQYAEYIENDLPSLTQYGYEFPPINEYIPVGEENEEYHPHFMHTSFRYVYIVGLNYLPDKKDIKAIFVHSDMKEKSFFRCSNENLNYIDKCIRRGYKSNLINIPTDCPGRERRGWTADSYAVVDSQCFMYDVYNIYDRWHNDLHDNQRLNGWCCVEYPDQTDPCVDLNWPMHTVINPWTIYEHYGDIRILKKNIDSMEKYVDLLYELSDKNIFSENLFSYGDWVSIDRATGAYIGSALYYYVTKLVANAEEIIGNYDKAKKYTKRSIEIADSINLHYLHKDGTKVYYDTGTQSANTLALAFGFCGEERENVFKTLVEDIENNKSITLGFIANTWFYNVLCDNGRNDLSYKFLTDSSYTGASLLNMVMRLKNETLNESFVNITDSLNHAFLGGGAAAWIFRGLMGVSAVESGYKKYVLAPYFDKDLEYVDTYFETPQGKLGIAWKREGEHISLQVTAPYNADGVIYLNGVEHKLSMGINHFVI